MRPGASISCKIGDDKTRARKEEFSAMKTLPYDKAKIEEIAKTHPTPFHIYDEAGIVAAAQRLQRAFQWNAGYKEYYAVKACPNPAILRLLHDQGCGLDC